MSHFVCYIHSSVTKYGRGAGSTRWHSPRNKANFNEKFCFCKVSPDLVTLLYRQIRLISRSLWLNTLPGNINRVWMCIVKCAHHIAYREYLAFIFSLKVGLPMMSLTTFKYPQRLVINCTNGKAWNRGRHFKQASTKNRSSTLNLLKLRL